MYKVFFMFSHAQRSGNVVKTSSETSD